jgi:histone-lysine N-methyltransferase SETMAR
VSCSRQRLQLLRVTPLTGVFALENIPSGAFVCEYAGQRISVAAAVSRTCESSAHGPDSAAADRHNYVLVYKEHFSDGRSVCTCLDPTRIGNVARFINHSCGPNLHAFAVRVGACPLPRVAFFAEHDICIGDELSFSYQDSSAAEEDGSHRKPCLCGHRDCRKW